MRHSPWLLWLAALAVSLFACRPRLTPAEQARRAIDSAVQAVRDKDLKAVAGFISESYADAHQNDRSQILSLVRLQTLTRPKLYVATKFVSVDCPRPEQANAHLFGAMAAVPVSDWSQASADVYRFDLVLANEDGTWRLRSADWTPASVGDLL